MPVSATPDLTAAPKVRVTISSPDGSAMTSLALYRLFGGGNVEQTRVQPLTGFSSRTIDDFEMPWNTPVAYRADMTYNGGTVSQTSATVTVNPDRAWMIHPTVPGLSVAIDAQNPASAGIVEHGDATWAATRTLFDIVDSPYPVPVKVGSGARKATTTALRIRTVTGAEANAIRAAINDQTPLLIRIPEGWGWDWEGTYYDVGDVTSSRFIQYGPEHGRIFNLPLQRVTAPAGTQQSTWSYPQLLNNFADYPSLRRGYQDYPALQANSRN